MSSYAITAQHPKRRKKPLQGWKKHSPETCCKMWVLPAIAQTRISPRRKSATMDGGNAALSALNEKGKKAIMGSGSFFSHVAQLRTRARNYLCPVHPYTKVLTQPWPKRCLSVVLGHEFSAARTLENVRFLARKIAQISAIFFKFQQRNWIPSKALVQDYKYLEKF